MLDLADALQYVTAHLSCKDCQSLRSTCRLLHHHPAVVAGISEVEVFAHEHLKALRQLTGLRCLRVCEASRLPKLTRVFLSCMPILDLQPLSYTPSLRSLMLMDVDHYASLPSLQQLDSLFLKITTATPAVLQLSALTMLGLSEGSQVANSGQLSQLQGLTIYPNPPAAAQSWTDGQTTALSATISQGLPALGTLGCPDTLLPPLSSLVQLTGLLLCFDGDDVPAHLQDLRQLTGLAKLGLHNYVGQPQLQSDSVTALFLCIRPKGEADDLGIMYDEEGGQVLPVTGQLQQAHACHTQL